MRRHYRVVRLVVYRQTSLDVTDQAWTFAGAFSAMALLGLLEQYRLPKQDNLFLIGSFGASCVIRFGLRHNPLARPRNLIGGHLLGSLIGVAIHKLLPDQLWLSSALAVSLSIVCMQITRTMHPPGGATALIANIGSEKITGLGFRYTLTPVMTGVIILLGVALLIDILRGKRTQVIRSLCRSEFATKRKESVQ